jgi:hypothetical protein
LTSMIESVAEYLESFSETALLAPNGVLTDEAEENGEGCVTGGEAPEIATDITGARHCIYAFAFNIAAPAVTHAQRSETRQRLEMLYDALCDAQKQENLPVLGGARVCEDIYCFAPQLTDTDDSGIAQYSVPFNITVTERE